ncbi:hypothetical protein LJC04_06915, partial [Ruminococcaceae bacterium OttesenSCG-928-O06]|nr:hypothetical protein [Ruminococcaceae bacterium OttesenSCG-928-O06]
LGHSGLLYGLSPFLPVKALAAIVAKGISVEAVSYTNLGQIDASRLRFSGCSIRSCVLAGSWKKAPLFQLCVSSWRGGCILSAATISSPAGQATAAAMLRATAAELSAWAGPA